MHWLKSAISILLLAAWLPVTNHCYLEMAGIVPTDHCSTSTKAASSKNDPCESGCKLVEKAGSKIQDEKPSGLFAVNLLVLLAPPFSVKPLPATLSSRLAQWPSPTLHLPQFRARTSFPARAPAFIS